MARLRNFWRRIDNWLSNPGVVALLLGLAGVLVTAAGVIYHQCECLAWPNYLVEWEWEKDFEALYANLGITLIGIAIAVFTIDRANERREERQTNERLRAQFSRAMGSTDNGIALNGASELRAHGWLGDGSLCGVDLNRANLREGNLSRANLSKVDLRGADLSKSDLMYIDLSKANLHEADLRASDLLNANLSEAYLRLANLSGAYLRAADLSGAVLWNADLSGTDLLFAKLNGTDLRGADLRGANLSGANLTGAVGALLEGAILRGTTMPNGSKHE